MAHSRLEKIGTIYSRVTGLVKTGAMKLEDRPLWYQVYQAFPPEQEPLYGRPVPDIPIRTIFYPEDIIRAKFYKKVSHLPPINLSDHKEATLSQKCIELCLQVQKEQGLNIEEAFDEAFERLKAGMFENMDGQQSQKSREATKQTATGSAINVSKLLQES